MPKANGHTVKVYLIRGANLYKIGSAVDPRARLRELQIGSPMKLTLIAWGEGGQAREFALHREFAQFRRHGEWFALDGHELRRATKLVWDVRAGLKRGKAKQVSGRDAHWPEVVKQRTDRRRQSGVIPRDGRPAFSPVVVRTPEPVINEDFSPF